MRLFRKPRFHSLFLITLFICSCSPKYSPYQGNKAFSSTSGIPDYANLDYWAAHPDKWDPSDSVPRPLLGEPSSREVDVFFVHPTTFTEDHDSNSTNARIDDPYLNAKTDFSTILSQASVFNASARIFAPRYRQAHIHMYFVPDGERKTKAFDLAYEDVKTAFRYYLDHFNQGRPIIIASHSQGTTHTQRLIHDFFSGKSLRNRLVAAYLIGMPVKKSAYPDIPVCQDSMQTGCIISWRTFRSGYEEPPYDASDTGTVVVNPLLWSTHTDLAPATLNKGAVLYKFNKVYPHTNNAQIHGNILWISRPKFPGSTFYTSRNYHIGDINLFYLNIREDVRRRISMFWKH
jgi:Protein of unknown function (DUF3089)